MRELLTEKVPSNSLKTVTASHKKPMVFSNIKTNKNADAQDRVFEGAETLFLKSFRKEMYYKN
jgi:hypothetical protein